jgi:hypothetical protein
VAFQLCYVEFAELMAVGVIDPSSPPFPSSIPAIERDRWEILAAARLRREMNSCRRDGRRRTERILNDLVRLHECNW